MHGICYFKKLYILGPCRFATIQKEISGDRFMYYELILKFSFDTPRKAEDLLNAYLIDLEPMGWEETKVKDGQPRCWKIFFSDQVSIPQIRLDLQQFFIEQKFPLPFIQVEEKEEEDWMTNFRESFQSQQAAPGWIIAPPWEAESVKQNTENEVVIIEPGMAFGTGLHETTRLCIEMIDNHFAGFLNPEARPKTVIDIGAGSGILSIVSIKLGALSVDAVEIDPQAEENMQMNIAFNQIEDQIRIQINNLSGADLQPADLVVCNMLISRFEPISKKAFELLNPDGFFILSGFLETEIKEVKTILEKYCLEILDQNSIGEWAVFLLKKLPG